MKTVSLAIGLLLAGSTLSAQTPAPDSLAAHASALSTTQRLDRAASRASNIVAAEAAHGTATPKGHEAPHGTCAPHVPGDNITPHITDSHCLEVPNGFRFWEPREIALPRFAPLHIGGVAIDLSPTKHVVFLLLAAVLCCAVLITAARAHVKHTHAIGRPKGFAAGIEAMVLYIRNEIAIKNLGPHGAGYAPFILALFWFILFTNLLGLFPYGSTATGNISVTAVLAIITFIVVEIAGMRAQGSGYLHTIFYWNKDMPLIVRIPMFLLMTPIEFIGKLTKPFALMIRLFANMTAGHIVVLALLGLVFTFKSYFIAPIPLAMALGIMFLELFVAFLQAFIFALLASVFIGQIREAHH